MRRNSLPFITLSLIFLFGVACAYSSFNVLAEADFLSGKKYEASDSEEVYAEKQSSPDAVLVSPGLFAPVVSFSLAYSPVVESIIESRNDSNSSSISFFFSRIMFLKNF